MALCKIQTFSKNLFSTTKEYFFHERCSSNKIPRNLTEDIYLISFQLIANKRSLKVMLSFWRNLWKKGHFIFTSFNYCLLAFNQMDILFSAKFTLSKMYLILLWDVKRFLSLSDVIGCTNIRNIIEIIDL